MSMILRIQNSVFVLAGLILAACDSGPRPLYEPPPPAMRHVRAVPQASSAVAGRASTRSTRGQGLTVVGPSGPLEMARVETYMDALESELRHHLHGSGMVVARQGNNINVVVPDTLLFTDDGGVAGDDVLEPLGAILRGYGHTAIQVSGFTDSTSSPEHNLSVSARQAHAIADALVHEGVSSQRITSQGLGQSHPRISTRQGHKEPRNRRIEILLRAQAG